MNVQDICISELVKGMLDIKPNGKTKIIHKFEISQAHNNYVGSKTESIAAIVSKTNDLLNDPW